MRKIRSSVAAALLYVGMTAAAQESQDSIRYGGWDRFSFSGDGEVWANFMDYGEDRFGCNGTGSGREMRNTIATPTFTLNGDFKITDKWIVGVEVGVCTDEMNITCEQLHLTRLIDRALNVRVGRLRLPIGTSNMYDDLLDYNGAKLSEGESTMIPTTWREAGVEFFGTLGKGKATFDYYAYITSGLNGSGFDRANWATEGVQGNISKERFNNPAYALRLDWRGIEGLTIGTSFYYCSNVGGNTAEPQKYKGTGKMPIRIYNLDGTYENQYLKVRGNVLYGSLTNSALLTMLNDDDQTDASPDVTSAVAHRVLSCSGEVGLNVRGILGSAKCPDIIPFVRYEHYNTQSSVSSPYSADPRSKVSMWTAGINWHPLPDLAVKANYTTRRIGGGAYNSENELAVGVAWSGCFWQK